MFLILAAPRLSRAQHPRVGRGMPRWTVGLCRSCYSHDTCGRRKLSTTLTREALQTQKLICCDSLTDSSIEWEALQSGHTGRIKTRTLMSPALARLLKLRLRTDKLRDLPYVIKRSKFSNFEASQGGEGSLDKQLTPPHSSAAGA